MSNFHCRLRNLVTLEKIDLDGCSCYPQTFLSITPGLAYTDDGLEHTSLFGRLKYHIKDNVKQQIQSFF